MGEIVLSRSVPGSLSLAELVEVAVRLPQPSDATGVGEPDDGPDDVHVGTSGL